MPKNSALGYERVMKKKNETHKIRVERIEGFKKLLLPLQLEIITMF